MLICFLVLAVGTYLFFPRVAKWLVGLTLGGIALLVLGVAGWFLVVQPLYVIFIEEPAEAAREAIRVEALPALEVISTRAAEQSDRAEGLAALAAHSCPGVLVPKILFDTDARHRGLIWYVWCDRAETVPSAEALAEANANYARAVAAHAVLTRIENEWLASLHPERPLTPAELSERLYPTAKAAPCPGKFLLRIAHGKIKESCLP